MPSLREVIEENKKRQQLEAQNAASTQSVLRPAIVTEKTSQNTSGNETQKETGQTASGEIHQINVQPEHSLVEQGPPPELKGLALLKWRKEHGSKHNGPSGIEKETFIQSSTNSIDEPRNRSINTTNDSSKNGIGSNTISNNSIAETEKPNDGRIDIEELRRNLVYLANHIEQKELVGQVVRTIASQLKNSPELCPYMSDADVDLVLRGARRAYNIQARKKSERREENVNKTKNNAELQQAFRDAGLDGLNLGLKL